MRAIVEGGEVIESLRDRILGRVAAEDVLHPENRATLVTAGTMLDEDTIEELEAAGVDEVKVRTALTCATRFGNVINFQGEPYLPGNDLIARSPAAA